MSLGTILSKIAPDLEAALPLVGGPYGALASMAIKAVSGVVSPDEPNPTVASVTQALMGATPDQLLKLTEVNNQFKLDTAKLGLDAQRIAAELEEREAAGDVADRGSARQAFSSLRYLPQMVLSTVFVAGYLVLVYELVHALLTGEVKIESVNSVVLSLVSTLVGIMTAAVTQILNFWFGSSHGSQKKDDALAAAAAS